MTSTRKSRFHKSILAFVLLGTAWLPSGAQAAFGINDFDVSFGRPDGSPASQAGSHPFTATFSLAANFSGEETDGRLRELLLEQDPGFLADTTAYPRCKTASFLELKNGTNACPDVTAVGTAASSFTEPGHSTIAPVFNLVPPPGVLMRLGFRVADAANIVVDVGLSPYPPHNPIAIAGEGPATIDVFAVEVVLWGTPAAPTHDEERGRCALLEEGLCPVNHPERPLLTLPTRCGGLLLSSYAAISWEGDLDFGSVVGVPPSLVGCSKVAFGPSVAVKLTTEEAQSPTGLDLSIAVFDDGLGTPIGLSQSQVRSLVLVLPKGMTASVGDGFGVCSEADLEEEDLQMGAGEGCPEASRVGTVEVESPLVVGPIKGALYRATSHQELLGGAPMALYVVLEDVDLGIVVKQVVEIEPDPETGQLLAIADDMPQLPFSHLRLHLDEGSESPLVTPPRCGVYPGAAEFAPWSQKAWFTIPSTFKFTSGPHEGPCPVDSGVQPSPAASAPTAPAKGTSFKHRCPKGKRRVRRKGRVRCVKRGRRVRKHRASRHRHRQTQHRVLPHG